MLLSHQSAGQKIFYIFFLTLVEDNQILIHYRTRDCNFGSGHLWVNAGLVIIQFGSVKH